MEKEPLLSTNTPKPPSVLCPLPEHDEISIPLSLTPSEIKDMLIFGSPREPIVDALALNLNNRPFSSDFNSNLVLNPNGICESDQVSVPVPVSVPVSGSGSTPKTWLTDPNYSFGKTNLHRSKTAPAMAAIKDFERVSDAKPPQSGSSSIVRQSVLLLILYLSLGVVIYWYNRDHFVASETHVVVDALYFCIVTMCTIGYGDITPNTVVTKLFSIMFVLVGFGFIDILLSGMVSYVLDLQESHLLRSLKNGHDVDHPSYIIDVKKGRMRIQMKVALALGVVVLCIGVGVGVMHYVERLYFCVGLVACVDHGCGSGAFLYLAEARVDKRNRRMAKWVLDQGLTVFEFLAANIDNNGYVRCGFQVDGEKGIVSAVCIQCTQPLSIRLVKSREGREP